MLLHSDRSPAVHSVPVPKPPHRPAWNRSARRPATDAALPRCAFRAIWRMIVADAAARPRAPTVKIDTAKRTSMSVKPLRVPESGGGTGESRMSSRLSRPRSSEVTESTFNASISGNEKAASRPLLYCNTTRDNPRRYSATAASSSRSLRSVNQDLVRSRCWCCIDAGDLAFG